jgi:hypothetical protein
MAMELFHRAAQLASGPRAAADRQIANLRGRGADARDHSILVMADGLRGVFVNAGRTEHPTLSASPNRRRRAWVGRAVPLNAVRPVRTAGHQPFKSHTVSTRPHNGLLRHPQRQSQNGRFPDGKGPCSYPEVDLPIEFR